MTLRFLIPLLLSAALPLQAGVYKWYSNDGTVHYSDVPHSGAVEMVLPTDLPVLQDDGVQGDYSQFEIETPVNDATLRDTKGHVSVVLIISPALQEGHSIRYFVDGKALTADFKTSQISLQNVTKGSHSLMAQVIDGSGNTIRSSSTIRFHLRKAAL
jgi:hypothetical protein